MNTFWLNLKMSAIILLMSKDIEKITDEKDDVDIIDRHRIIEIGLDQFLHRSKSILSDQNFDRSSRHLLTMFRDTQILTPFVVENHLCKLLEHKEYHVDAIDKDETDVTDNPELSEELLTSIIITADKAVGNENYKSSNITIKGRISLWLKKIYGLSLSRKLAFASVVFLIFLSPIVSYHYTMQTQVEYEIGLSAAKELKGLVSQLSNLEKQHGRKISKTSIWSELKTSKAIASLGYKSSYKKFSVAQYNVAKQYLLERIVRLEAKPVKNTDKTFLAGN